MKKVREELNRISNDRFHNRKIKYAINIRKDERSAPVIQILFDEIIFSGGLIILVKGDECCCSFEKEIFKLKFSHYQDSSEKYLTIHYDFYL